MNATDNYAAIRERLAKCCYTCHEFVASDTADACLYCGLSEWIHYYKRDVAALLAEIDGRDDGRSTCE